MAAEKLIASLEDLQEAARLAAQEGLCRIRLVDGKELLLCPASSAPGGDEEVCDVTDPGEEDAVLSCLRPGGQVYEGDEARKELIRRLSARGIGKPDAPR